ncbi:MAG: hypothetical protein Q9184_006183 [Pyrenodesmia sp. 2 TL-2023]
MPSKLVQQLAPFRLTFSPAYCAPYALSWQFIALQSIDMQNAGDNARAYEGAAADGSWMENHWTDQPLDPWLASPFEGGAGGSHSEEPHAFEPHKEPQQYVCLVPGCVKAPFPNAEQLVLHHQTYHTNPAAPIPVIRHHATPYDAGNTAIHGDLLMCPYPGCFGLFYSQWSLNEHSQIHANHQGALAVNTLGYNNSFSGLPASRDQHLDFSTSEAYGRFPQTSGASDNTLTAAPASPPHPVVQANHAIYHAVGAVSERASLRAVPSSSSRSAASPGGRFVCSRLDCNKTFARNGDLRRHAKDHEPGPKAWDCLAPGCPRKGLRAFSRKDKMLDHFRVCRARAANPNQA